MTTIEITNMIHLNKKQKIENVPIKRAEGIARRLQNVLVKENISAIVEVK